ncbi:MAG: hypothetical protein LBL41_03720 [Bifidobacteriaceae bacterium]|nr:hypothetical protein [Bifidobacteriaceae bacterium]
MRSLECGVLLERGEVASLALACSVLKNGVRLRLTLFGVESFAFMIEKARLYAVPPPPPLIRVELSLVDTFVPAFLCFILKNIIPP